MTAPTDVRRGLAGRGVIVTRPAGQSDGLAKCVEREGGKAIVFPVIAIEDVADRERLMRIVDRLDDFDLAIFVSPSAVAKAMAAITGRRAFPSSLTAAAVGPGGARELKRRGIERVLVPPARFDSEGLLDLPELRHVAGRHVVIFRGEGGRALLAETLALRGARVTFAECYRRVKPQADVAPLVDAWDRGEVHAVIATSSEGLRNFHDMLGEAGRAALRRTPVFVPHPRIKDAAHALGIAEAFVTAAGDEAMVAGIVSHFA
ncbi:MAG TPA: uroporphyrinogen-III synthase [Burkholderiales bacterium]|nr:uroporphyrinogen-III synthase [Burkholderiales bacterium]